MSAIIQRILDLSGPMPDRTRHARYLERLSADQLQDRERLLLDGPGQPSEVVEFWAGHKKTRSLARPEVAA
jgi:hypothetical protein